MDGIPPFRLMPEPLSPAAEALPALNGPGTMSASATSWAGIRTGCKGTRHVCVGSAASE